MAWTVLLDDAFEAEFRSLSEALQDELLAHALLLQEFGPNLGRPTVDTLKASRHANMKELRFKWEAGVWRVAFAFDPKRRAVLLVGGNKGGTDQRRFYKRLIATADARFEEHLMKLDASGVMKKEVGVGIMVTHNPLHRSGLAEFPHPALASGNDAKAA